MVGSADSSVTFGPAQGAMVTASRRVPVGAPVSSPIVSSWTGLCDETPSRTGSP